MAVLDTLWWCPVGHSNGDELHLSSTRNECEEVCEMTEFHLGIPSTPIKLTMDQAIRLARVHSKRLILIYNAVSDTVFLIPVTNQEAA